MSWRAGDEEPRRRQERTKCPGVGSVRAVTGADGEVEATAAYDTWGTATGDEVGRLGFGGHYTDDITGSVFLGARWYDPGTGHFVSLTLWRPSAGTRTATPATARSRSRTRTVTSRTHSSLQAPEASSAGSSMVSPTCREGVQRCARVRRCGRRRRNRWCPGGRVHRPDRCGGHVRCCGLLRLRRRRSKAASEQGGRHARPPPRRDLRAVPTGAVRASPPCCLGVRAASGGGETPPDAHRRRFGVGSCQRVVSAPVGVDLEVDDLDGTVVRHRDVEGQAGTSVPAAINTRTWSSPSTASVTAR